MSVTRFRERLGLRWEGVSGVKIRRDSLMGQRWLQAENEG
jgi:hypothetical protein